MKIHKLIMRYVKEPLYKTSFFVALTNIFNIGCGFLFWMVAARVYSIEEVGLATAWISSLGLVVLFSRLGLDFAIVRYFQIDDKKKVFGTCLVITTIASLLVGISYIVLAEFLSLSLTLKEPQYAMLFLLFGAANTVTIMSASAFLADRKAESFLFQNIFMAARIPLLIPLGFLGTFGIFSSFGLGYLLASFFAVFILQRSLAITKLEIDLNFVRRGFRFTLWNYVSNILYMLPTLIIPIMILKMVGEAEAAKYYIGFAIANLILIIPNSLGTSLFVEGSHGESLRKSVMRAGGASIIIMLPVVLILFFFGDLFLGLLGGEYIEAFSLLRVLALSSFLVLAYSLFVPIQNVRMDVNCIVKLNAIRTVLLLVLSYVLIQRYGILGAGYGWMITYGIIGLWISKIIMGERWV